MIILLWAYWERSWIFESLFFLWKTHRVYHIYPIHSYFVVIVANIKFVQFLLPFPPLNLLTSFKLVWREMYPPPVCVGVRKKERSHLLKNLLWFSLIKFYYLGLPANNHISFESWWFPVSLFRLKRLLFWFHVSLLWTEHWDNTAK